MKMEHKHNNHFVYLLLTLTIITLDVSCAQRLLKTTVNGTSINTDPFFVKLNQNILYYWNNNDGHRNYKQSNNNLKQEHRSITGPICPEGFRLKPNLKTCEFIEEIEEPRSNNLFIYMVAIIPSILAISLLFMVMYNLYRATLRICEEVVQIFSE